MGEPADGRRLARSAVHDLILLPQLFCAAPEARDALGLPVRLSAPRSAARDVLRFGLVE